MTEERSLSESLASRWRLAWRRVDETLMAVDEAWATPAVRRHPAPCAPSTELRCRPPHRCCHDQQHVGPTGRDEREPQEYTLVVESLLDDARAAGRADEKYQQLLKGDDASDGVQRRDGLVYSRDGRLYVPECRRLRTRLLELAHDNVGHFGRDRTLERLSRHCVWDGMSKEVADWCRSCAVCAAVKTSSSMQAGQLRPLPVPERAWDSVGVDFTGPLPQTDGRPQQHHGHRRPSDGHADTEAVLDRPSRAARRAELLLDAMLGVGRLPTSIVSDRDVRFTGAGVGPAVARPEDGAEDEHRVPPADGREDRESEPHAAGRAARVRGEPHGLGRVAAVRGGGVQQHRQRVDGPHAVRAELPRRRAIDPLQWALGGQLAHGTMA